MEKTKKEKKPLMTKNEKEFVCTLFALIIIAIFFIATPPSGLSADGMKVLGVFISVLFLWNRLAKFIMFSNACSCSITWNENNIAKFVW